MSYILSIRSIGVSFVLLGILLLGIVTSFHETAALQVPKTLKTQAITNPKKVTSGEIQVVTTNTRSIADRIKSIKAQRAELMASYLKIESDLTLLDAQIQALNTKISVLQMLKDSRYTSAMRELSIAKNRKTTMLEKRTTLSKQIAVLDAWLKKNAL